MHKITLQKLQTEVKNGQNFLENSKESSETTKKLLNICQLLRKINNEKKIYDDNIKEIANKRQYTNIFEANTLYLKLIDDVIAKPNDYYNKVLEKIDNKYAVDLNNIERHIDLPFHEHLRCYLDKQNDTYLNAIFDSNNLKLNPDMLFRLYDIQIQNDSFLKLKHYPNDNNSLKEDIFQPYQRLIRDLVLSHARNATQSESLKKDVEGAKEKIYQFYGRDRSKFSRQPPKHVTHRQIVPSEANVARDDIRANIENFVDLSLASATLTHTDSYVQRFDQLLAQTLGSLPLSDTDKTVFCHSENKGLAPTQVDRTCMELVAEIRSSDQRITNLYHENERYAELITELAQDGIPKAIESISNSLLPFIRDQLGSDGPVGAKDVAPTTTTTTTNPTASSVPMKSQGIPYPNLVQYLNAGEREGCHEDVAEMGGSNYLRELQSYLGPRTADCDQLITQHDRLIAEKQALEIKLNDRIASLRQKIDKRISRNGPALDSLIEHWKNDTITKYCVGSTLKGDSVPDIPRSSKSNPYLANENKNSI